MNWIAATLAMLMCLGISMDAQADVPGTMTYHGTLSDGSGSPVDTTVGATFRIYDAQSGGSEVWSEQFSTIDVNSGSFSVQLGATQPLVDVFDGSPYWLEVSINGETLSPRTAVESVPYALRANKANKANDADTVAGQTPSDLTASMPTTAADLSYDNATSGLSATDVQAALDVLAQLRARIDALESGMQDASGNPVTVADLDTRISQNTSDLSSLASDISTLQADVAANTSAISTNTTAIATNTSEISTNTSAISTNTSAISSLQADVTANTNDISTNSSAISALETLTQDMSRTTINGQPSVAFSGVNVHVRNGGLGATDGNTGSGPQVNALGNLIVGYDEARLSGSDKSGSHNLVLGSEHNYSSYGGLIAGQKNTITARYASVIGGADNTASGNHASISGGAFNTASGSASLVSGGVFNTASGVRYSTVSGGSYNISSGEQSSVSGGFSNTASGYSSSVSGGQANTASGSQSSVSGGSGNEASGDSSTIGGGRDDILVDDYYWQAGDLIEVE